MPDFPATDPLFLSTLSLRRATPRPSPSCHPVWDFYPRSPCGERPLESWPDSEMRKISIHALLAESDLLGTPDTWAKPVFLSTLSLRRATDVHIGPNVGRYDFYPRSPCGERPIAGVSKRKGGLISIHALLAESDVYLARVFAAADYFYPRSPCGERPSIIILDEYQKEISIHALLAESDQIPHRGRIP